MKAAPADAENEGVRVSGAPVFFFDARRRVDAILTTI
jgi:hypothetical protein